jgi:hypothetical protein
MLALETPTRFLIESGEWNLTPNIGGSIHNEVNPFDCIKSNDKWSRPSLTTTDIIYTASPEPEMNQVVTPTTPPMTFSQSPTSTSASFRLSSEPTHSPSTMNSTDMMPIQKQQQRFQFVEPPTQQCRTSSRNQRIQQQQSFFPHYLEDDEVDYEPISAPVQSGRKRRIVFEGDDAEDRRKKFLERNRVAGNINFKICLHIVPLY